MKVKILAGISVIALVIAINSCEDKAPLPAGVSLPSYCDTTNLTYTSGTNNVKSLIDIQCGTSNSSCHAAKGASGFDYTSYASIIATGNFQKGGLAITCMYKGEPVTMPKIPQAGWADSNACMKPRLKAWIDAGAPQ